MATTRELIDADTLQTKYSNAFSRYISIRIQFNSIQKIFIGIYITSIGYRKKHKYNDMDWTEYYHTIRTLSYPASVQRD